MVSSEKLLQATLNRLSSRMGEELLVSINKLTEVIKTAPEKVRSEWELFQDEVYEEAERLEKESNEATSPTSEEEARTSEKGNIQRRIEQIREKVEELSNKLEENS